MHIPMPTHDTRRGSSRYRGAMGYAEADALEDRNEREMAMDAVRQRALREHRADAGIPTPHQVNALLADAIGLALADPEIRDTIAARLGHHLRRAIRARALDPRAPETKRVLAIRMRPSQRILEIEASERIAAEVAAMSDARRQATLDETIALLDALRDDD